MKKKHSLSNYCFAIRYFLPNRKKLTDANKKYEEHAYIKAAEIYRDVVETGFESQELFEKLANSYYFNVLIFPHLLIWQIYYLVEVIMTFSENFGMFSMALCSVERKPKIQI